MDRSKRFTRGKMRLLAASLALNGLIVATFVTSSPQVSPASNWIVATKRFLYSAGIKPSSDIYGIHSDSRLLAPEDCVACHGTMKQSDMQLHRIHLASEIASFKCQDCHDRISIEPKSNEKVVHMVNVGFCKKCHSKFAGLNPNSAMKPVDFLADCTRCHTGDHQPKHAQSYLIPATTISKRECPGCHGARILPWTPEHEKPTWISKHGAVALSMGRTECMACHSHGLRFCNSCHEKRPPLHNPKDTWLARHSERARQDTRVCLACHASKFCERCHRRHTSGWQLRHSVVVVKNGSETCRNCHSVLFCEGCHTKGPESFRPNGNGNGSAPAGRRETAPGQGEPRQ